MTDDELGFLPITQLASLIRQRQLSPVELIEGCLRRTEHLDGKLHTYVTVAGDEAIEAARKVEASLARGPDNAGPLQGIPFGVKDQMDARGLPTTRGSDRRASVARADATVVARLKAAGAILIGKHVLTGSAAGGPAGFPFGLPRNPWGPDHHPGGSSNGSAVAAGLVPMAFGEDTGGSIRVPAAFNGINGLRPSWGRVPLHGVGPIVRSMDTVGPLARSAEDCALILQTVAGDDPKDPWVSAAPIPDYTAALYGPMAGTRIGMVREYLEAPNLDRELFQGVMKASKCLEDSGAILEDVSLPLLELAPVIATMLNDSAMAGRYRASLNRSPEAHSAVFRWRLNAAALLPAVIHHRIAQGRMLLRRQILDAFSRVDILLAPCTPGPAPLIRRQTAPGLSSTEEAHRLLYQDYPYTSAYSLAGLPAISVPCGFTLSGLPIGLQLAARPFGESALLHVAHRYQM